MNDEHGIYQRADKDSPKAEGGIPYNAMRDERPRMWRTFGLFILLMLSLLAVTSYFLYLEEQELEDQTKLAEDLDGLVDSQGTNEVDIPVPMVDSVLQPYLDLDDELKADVLDDPTAEHDPDKMVEAMREARIARDYLAQREFDGAQLHCEKALEIWPDMNIALRLLGVVFWQRGRFDDSIVVLERALEGNPFSPEIFNNMAMSYLQKGQLDKAQELLETALDLNPEFYITSINLGFLYLTGRRYDLAAEYIEFGLQGYPNNVDARNNLAVALMRLHRLDEAREHLRTVMEASPGVAYPYFNMALTYVVGGDAEMATEWVRQGDRNCTLPELRDFLADPDFDEIRNYGPFKDFVAEKFSE